ncbi:MAG: sigma-70 family RNA polymerase sigma factor [Deltaproteobacteria bacterium]|nr:sigma-70 family RNA polymerase sigma factor [Deltaproteobacteria bacterium]
MPDVVSAAGPEAGPGSVADIGALFDEHAPFLLRVTTRLLGGTDQVEDLVQEVFLTAHRRRHELSSHPEPRAWLYGVAVNLVRHHRRSFARRRALVQAAAREVPETSPGPLDQAQRRQHAELIRSCVAELPLEQREAFVLYELECLEGRVIAELLGVPENTVWSRLHLARKKFRALWARRAR